MAWKPIMKRGLVCAAGTIVMAIVLLMPNQGKGETGTAGTLKWSFPTGGMVVSSPALANDGTIYIGSADGNLYALTADGSESWHFSTGSSISSSPAVSSDGTIYVESDTAVLYALSPDGSEKWHYDMGTESLFFFSFSPVLGSDGTVYVGSNVVSDDLSMTGTLHAVNSAGTETWHYDMGGLASPPAVAADGTLYVGTVDQGLCAINPNGTLRWSCPINGSILSSPAIGVDNTIYVGATVLSGFSLKNQLYALGPAGSVKWTSPVGSDGMNLLSFSPVIGADATVYVVCDTLSLSDFSFKGYLQAIGPGGVRKWSYAMGSDSAGGSVTSAPVIGADGAIYAGSLDGNLYAVSPQGAGVWRFQAGCPIFSSPVMASDGTIYVGCEDGNVYAVSSLSGGPADSAWPMFLHDVKRSGLASPAAATRTLTIEKKGSGAGTVLSAPAGITCGPVCSYDYPTTTRVTLTARAGQIHASSAGRAPAREKQVASSPLRAAKR